MYCDIDDFKSVNDDGGHQAGDDLLRRFVQEARDHLRTSDTVARLGGDEFAMLLPETGSESARAVVGKLVAELDDAGLPHISVGVLSLEAPLESVDAIVSRVDQLMYDAKSSGKRTVCYDAVLTVTR